MFLVYTLIAFVILQSVDRVVSPRAALVDERTTVSSTDIVIRKIPVSSRWWAQDSQKSSVEGTVPRFSVRACILFVSVGFISVYCHRRGKDCNGLDIRYVQSGLAQCQQLCSADCQCKSIQQRQIHCWLKRHACSDAELNNVWYGNDYVRKGEEWITHFC